MLDDNKLNQGVEPNDFNPDPSSTAGDWNMDAESFRQADSVGQIYATTHTSKNYSAFMLLGICLLCIVAVYVFGQYQKPKQATEEEKAAELQVDTALAKLVSLNRSDEQEELFKDTESMVKAFYDYPSKQQVSVEDLQKNPFERTITKTVEKKDDAEDQRARLQKDLQMKVDAIKLGAVMQAAGGAKCLIDNEVKSVGDLVAETFTIQSIGSEQVKLAYRDFVFIVAMTN